MIINKLLLIPIFIISIYFLVIIHELGHYLMAKLFKLPVEEVCFGYGNTIYKFNYKETNFIFKLLGFGGHNRLEVSFLDSAIPRMFISLAGPMTSMLFGIVLLLFSAHTEVFKIITFGHGLLISNYFSSISSYFDVKFATNHLNFALYCNQGIFKLFLAYLGFFSYMVGLINLIPVPPFDGGRVIFHFYEIFITPNKREIHYTNLSKLSIYFILIVNLALILSQRS